MTERRTLVLLFLAALTLRVVHCVVFPNEVIPGGDQMQEIMLGRNFASGDLFGVLDTYWAPFYPMLIGIAAIFIDLPVLPALVVSVIASSLIVPLTYIFVRQSYGEAEALIAALLALFFPHFINAVVSVGSENVFIAVMLGVLITVWEARRTGSKARYLAAGLLLGMAYLTRPEAIGYSVYFVAAFVVLDLWRRKASLRGSLSGVASFSLGFALMAAPYVLYLRGETGRWTVSAKAEINTLVAELHDGPDSLGQGDPNRQAIDFAKYFLMNMIEVQKMLPVLFPLLLWPFIGLGLFAGTWSGERIQRELFLISFCLVTIAGYSAAVIQLRYFYVLLPILMGWSAAGIVVFIKWLRSTLSGVVEGRQLVLSSRSVGILLLIAIFLYVLPLNFYMRSAEQRWETMGYEERDAGLWLRRNGKTDPYVFSASRRPAFYAGARQLAPTSEDTNVILSEIKNQMVDYVVTSERSLKRNEYLAGFDELLKSDPDFEIVYHQVPRDGFGVSIFKRIGKN